MLFALNTNIFWYVGNNIECSSTILSKSLKSVHSIWCGTICLSNGQLIFLPSVRRRNILTLVKALLLVKFQSNFFFGLYWNFYKSCVYNKPSRTFFICQQLDLFLRSVIITAWTNIHIFLYTRNRFIKICEMTKLSQNTCKSKQTTTNAKRTLHWVKLKLTSHKSLQFSLYPPFFIINIVSALSIIERNSAAMVRKT